MNSNDSRLNILKSFSDPRINFVCLDYPSFLEHIEGFDGSSEEALDEGLEQFVSEMLNAKASIDQEQNEICLPKVLEDYKTDFGGSDSMILQFVFRYVEEEHECE